MFLLQESSKQKATSKRRNNSGEDLHRLGDDLPTRQAGVLSLPFYRICYKSKHTTRLELTYAIILHCILIVL